LNASAESFMIFSCSGVLGTDSAPVNFWHGQENARDFARLNVV